MDETNEWRKHWTTELYTGWEKDAPVKSSSSLTELTEQLNKHIEELGESVNWASEEIVRLRAENSRLCAEKTELELKVENLRYMLRTITQGQTIQ